MHFCCPQPAAQEPGCCLWMGQVWPYAPEILNLGRGKALCSCNSELGERGMALCSGNPEPRPNSEFFLGKERNAATTCSGKYIPVNLLDQAFKEK